ncbi:BamA/TamA family outer membrane protein [candidate division WOR-3 bacterium]|nr:BamA/TamA family outer membrane protein [candidate division WOR-3 bacterium]
MKYKYPAPKIFFVFLPLLFIHIPIHSQYFGQNKLQYRSFDWKVTETEHFRIFYYQGMDEIADFACQVSEDAYSDMSVNFDHDFSVKIPVLIYRSPNDFSQTNVILDLISESVGGFTEFLKNRVVVPFNGSFSDFRHVLTHEITHAFQNDVLYGHTNIFMKIYSMDVPLWWFEGSAEFESSGWNSESYMYLRDLVFSNKLVSLFDLDYYGGYIIYKEGQSVMYFIAQKYGRQKIGEIFHNIKVTGSLRRAIQKTLNIDYETFNEEWTKFLYSLYWPHYNSYAEIDDYSVRLTDTKKQSNYINLSPVISPDGLDVVFISDAGVYLDILKMSALTGKVEKKLVGGQRTPQFEGLHILTSHASWSPDGSRIILSSLSEGRDLFWIIDAESGQRIKKLDFDLDIARSPYWSYQNIIYFVGTVNGKTDIYSTDPEGVLLHKLTDDIFDDKDPFASNDGKYLYWCSDRNENDSWEYGDYAVFEMDLENGTVRELTPRNSSVSNPCLSSSSENSPARLLFLASYTPGNNLYSCDLETGEITQLTNLPGEIQSFSMDAKSSRMVLSVYTSGKWDIFTLQNPLETLEKLEFSLDSAEFIDVYTEVDRTQDTLLWKKPGIEISADWGQASMAYSSLYGFAGILTIYLSDFMGNHRFLIQTDLAQDVLKSNFNLIYYYLPKRWDVGFGVYQQSYAYWYKDDTINVDKYLGGEILFLYPFNRFQRFDLMMDVYQIERKHYYYDSFQAEAFFSGETSEVFIAPSLYYVFDNSLWGYTSPFLGTRMRFGGGVAQRISTNSRYYWGSFDFRKYWRITPRSNLAFRLYLSGIRGTNPPNLYLGGYNNLRGYDVNELTGFNTGFVSIEARFPFVDYLDVIFPVPLLLGGLRGCLFIDAGGTADYIKEFNVFSDDQERGFGLEDMKLDIGWGIRMFFMSAVLKLDFAIPTDLRNIDNRTKIHFSIGEDF